MYAEKEGSIIFQQNNKAVLLSECILHLKNRAIEIEVLLKIIYLTVKFSELNLPAFRASFHYLITFYPEEKQTRLAKVSALPECNFVFKLSTCNSMYKL